MALPEKVLGYNSYQTCGFQNGIMEGIDLQLIKYKHSSCRVELNLISFTGLKSKVLLHVAKLVRLVHL